MKNSIRFGLSGNRTALSEFSTSRKRSKHPKNVVKPEIDGTSLSLPSDCKIFNLIYLNLFDIWECNKGLSIR